MNITVKDTEPCRKLLEIELTYDEIKDDVKRIEKSIQQNAAVPGFRIGKAPMTLVERYYGDTIKTEIRHQVVHSVFQKILEEKNLHPVRPPAVSNVSYNENKGLTFKMDVEIAPEFQLPRYIGIQIEKKEIEVTEKHIEEELNYLQERHSHFEPVQGRPAAMGDFIIVDYEIKEKEEILEESKQRWIEMQEDFHIPDFCTHIAGMKRQDEKDIKATLPKEYPIPNLSGKKVVIHVKLNEIKKKVTPIVNDDFAKEVGGFGSVDELKINIKKQLDAHTERLTRDNMIVQIEEYLLNNTNLSVPPSVVSSFEQAIYEDTISWLRNSRKANDELIKEKDAEIKTASRKDAVKQVKMIYIFEGIAGKENISALDTETENYIRELSAKTGKNEKEIKDYLDKEDKWWNIKYRIRSDKIIDFLLNKAEVKGCSGLRV